MALILRDCVVLLRSHIKATLCAGSFALPTPLTFLACTGQHQRPYDSLAQAVAQGVGVDALEIILIRIVGRGNWS
jgi:hypothetical protein